MSRLGAHQLGAESPVRGADRSPEDARQKRHELDRVIELLRSPRKSWRLVNVHAGEQGQVGARELFLPAGNLPDPSGLRGTEKTGVNVRGFPQYWLMRVLSNRLALHTPEQSPWRRSAHPASFLWLPSQCASTPRASVGCVLLSTRNVARIAEHKAKV